MAVAYICCTLVVSAMIADPQRRGHCFELYIAQAVTRVMQGRLSDRLRLRSVKLGLPSLLHKKSILKHKIFHIFCQVRLFLSG